MAEWVEIDLGLILGPLEPLLSALAAIAETANVVLDPLADALEVIALFLLELDPSAFDISITADFLLEAEVVHLYPVQSYQALRFPRWTETLTRSFTLGPECALPPFEILVLLVQADAVGLLMELADNLRLFFGYARSAFDDLPALLDRPKILTKQVTCQPIEQLFPFGSEIRELLSSSITIKGSGPVGVMRDAILFKIEALRRRLSNIQRILDAITELDVPNVLFLAEEVTSRGAISGVLQSASGAPDRLNFVAGTGMLVNVATGLIFKTAVGLTASAGKDGFQTENEVKQ